MYIIYLFLVRLDVILYLYMKINYLGILIYLFKLEVEKFIRFLRGVYVFRYNYVLVRILFFIVEVIIETVLVVSK